MWAADFLLHTAVSSPLYPQIHACELLMQNTKRFSGVSSLGSENLSNLLLLFLSMDHLLIIDLHKAQS